MIDILSDEQAMRVAIEHAQNAASLGEVPVGALILSNDGECLGAAGNAPIKENDPTAHAEIRALRLAAKKRGNYRLTGTTLFVTLEPCAMCAGAISLSRVARLVIAAPDVKGGAVWHGPKFFDQETCHWRPDIVQGPFADEAGQLLKDFFRARR